MTQESSQLCDPCTSFGPKIRMSAAAAAWKAAPLRYANISPRPVVMSSEQLAFVHRSVQNLVSCPAWVTQFLRLRSVCEGAFCLSLSQRWGSEVLTGTVTSVPLSRLQSEFFSPPTSLGLHSVRSTRERREATNKEPDGEDARNTTWCTPHYVAKLLQTTLNINCSGTEKCLIRTLSQQNRSKGIIAVGAG